MLLQFNNKEFSGFTAHILCPMWAVRSRITAISGRQVILFFLSVSVMNNEMALGEGIKEMRGMIMHAALFTRHNGYFRCPHQVGVCQGFYRLCVQVFPILRACAPDAEKIHGNK